MSRPLVAEESIEGEALWAFCLALYARSEIEAACLALQDEQGLDVMLALFCVYAGTRGQKVDGPLLSKAVEIGRSWGSEIVGPLRLVRRRLKQPPPDVDPHDAYRLRTRLQALELDAERIQHELLASLLKDKGKPQAAIARANLIAYAGRLGVKPSRHFDVLIEAAFPKG